MKMRLHIVATIALLAVFSLAAGNWIPGLLESSPEDPCPPPGRGKDGSCNKKETLHFQSLPEAPTTTGGPDRFGYTWIDTATYDWKDATSGGTQVFTSQDDAISASIPLSMTFPYYENTYTHVRIGTNGVIGFNDSLEENSASQLNLIMPLDFEYPQDFIAPFWGDLWGGLSVSGGVWYKADAGGNYFVIEWYQVSHLSGAAVLTFEVVLYSNGDIVFQYAELTNPPASVTIGIEDQDGVNGLQYLYNSGPMPAGKAILFERPDPSRRTKAFPLYQSAFNVAHVSNFKVWIRNAGDLTSDDMFNLDIISSDPHWKVDLFQEDGATPLGNHDGNPLPDTGTLLQGEIFTATVRVTSPFDFTIAVSTTITLTASSSGDQDKTADIRLDCVKPTPFTQIYRETRLVEELNGLFIEVISPWFRGYSLMQYPYTGASVSLNDISSMRYLSLWENNLEEATDIDYMLIDSIGNKLITDPGHLYTDTFRNTFPVSATAYDGKIGVAWIHTQKVSNQYIQNVFFGIRNNDNTSWEYYPENITNNSLPNSIDIYKTPFASVTDDGYFHLTWVEVRGIAPNTTNEIGHAAFNLDGDTGTAPELFTTPQANVNYSSPSLVAYQNGSAEDKVLLVYFLADNTNPGNPTYDLLYGVLNSDGSTAQPQAELYDGINGKGLDGIQLTDGRIALAWTDQADDRVQYVLLGNDLSKPTQPTKLSQLDDINGRRSVGGVSVTRDSFNRAVLTWRDVSFLQRLYYALIEDNGLDGILTPPMVFKYALPGGVPSVESWVAFSNVPNTINLSRLSYIPLVIK